MKIVIFLCLLQLVVAACLNDCKKCVDNVVSEEKLTSKQKTALRNIGIDDCFSQCYADATYNVNSTLVTSNGTQKAVSDVYNVTGNTFVNSQSGKTITVGQQDALGIEVTDDNLLQLLQFYSDTAADDGNGSGATENLDREKRICKLFNYVQQHTDLTDFSKIGGKKLAVCAKLKWVAAVSVFSTLCKRDPPF